MNTQNVNDIRPEVVEVLDRTVYGVASLPQGGVVTDVKTIVRATDGLTYRCYYQSTWKDGVKSVTPFFGFSVLNDDVTPSPDEVQS